VTYVHHGGPLSDRRPLARDRVRFVGEEVAAVAAETAELAEAALRLIEVRYEPLAHVESIDDALRPGAPRLHARALGGNVSLRIERRYGDVAGARAAAATVVRGRYRFGRQAHACMEPNSTLARWDPEGRRLELWTSTQAPYFIRKEVAHCLGLSLDQVVTHEVAVGGGFGSKSKISEHEVLAAALAMRTAPRPVRLVLDREEEFSCTKCRHAFDIELETGADPEGRLTHREARMRVDNGAYNHSGPSVMGYGSLVMGSLYRVGAVHLVAELVDTNKHPGGQFRGYGGPQATFAIECQMDELAEAIGADPIDLRIANANREGDTTLAGWRISSAGLVQCLEAVREAIGWDAKRRLGGSGRGVGVAAAIHVSGAHVYEGAERADAGVDVLADGRIRVRFGGADAGTGQRTVLAQIAAEELGVPASEVEVLTMESDRTPPDLGAWSSRGTLISGSAVQAAARRAAALLREAAARKLGVEPSAVRLQDGQAVAGPDRVDLADLLPLTEGAEDGELRVEETFVADMEPVNPETGVSNLSPAYSFAAHAVEVEVDRDTGGVRVLRVVAAHDCGRAINPIAAESQVTGGVAMGLGAALGEELVYEQGRMANPAYISYPMLRAADAPPIQPILIDRPDPAGPYGAKGIGEISLVPTPAAVANAVSHALGVRIREIPITPDRVLRALREAGEKPPRRHHLWRRPDRWEISLVRWLYPRGLFALLHRYGSRRATERRSRPIREVVRPSAVEEAVEVLARAGGAAGAIAGGTDLLPARRQGLADPEVLVDLAGIEGLRGVREDGQGDLVIGAATTLADLARAVAGTGDLVLRRTVELIASPQVREMATVGGNLCQQKRCWFYRNGFPCYKRGGWTCPCYAVLGDHRFHHAVMKAHRCQAVTPSDLATTLVALDAGVTIAGPTGTRRVPVERLYSGPGEPALRRGEVLTEVRVPAGARARVSSFEKLRLWEGDFALASACASVALDRAGRVSEARVVLGAVAPTPYRAVAAERRLVGRSLDPDLIAAASEAWTGAAHPLPGNAWKVDAAAGLVRRALEGCAAGAAAIARDSQ
jgi:CO/xanthine dehydrogenase Mo-binding subunit/CO/xanthine dehydrogenase FAD-binding subunit